ncbi:hypothetical protein HUJ05_006617 [Dendroctonus ponderosae]|nr:hypothetical protein HUJ05_006617 [Dendroctonus ponderosae]
MYLVKKIPQTYYLEGLALVSSTLWWNGSTWLIQPVDFWPEALPHLEANNLPEKHTQGIIRVGGRLTHSAFSEKRKFPAILLAKHRLTLLIIKHEHHRLLHAGPQHLLASLRERFNSSQIEYLMGSLPKERLTPSRPFLVTGGDYMGPVMIKDRSTRNYKMNLLVIWLPYDVFFSRRGLSSDIFSEHGTNFIGAQNEIQKMLRINHSDIQSKLSIDGIRWHFIPPRAPHFGGLWEAGVKSTKHHLKREYVVELQQRTKWKGNAVNLLSPGSLVPIKEDGLPPLKWMMGVVQEVHPGADGVIRTATIKTASSTLKRPVIKLHCHRRMFEPFWLSRRALITRRRFSVDQYLQFRKATELGHSAIFRKLKTVEPMGLKANRIKTLSISVPFTIYVLDEGEMVERLHQLSQETPYGADIVERGKTGERITLNQGTITAAFQASILEITNCARKMRERAYIRKHITIVTGDEAK